MRVQELFEGKGSLAHLGKLAEEQSWKKLFVVTDKNSWTLSGAEKIIVPLFPPESLFFFDSFDPNPKLEDALRGIDYFLEVNPDVIIAAGGGSAIDMAKLINGLSSDRNNMSDYVTGKKKLEKKAVPLVAVPTTAGTGSEATHFAVVYMDKVKYSLADKLLKPSFVILDPGLVMSVPPYITACTLMDALCQAMESLWSVNSTEESDKYAEEAVKLILDNSPAENGLSVETRKNHQKAAYLAGKAIDITKTTAAHALSYYLTSYHNIPHGHAVGLMFGWVFAQNCGVNEDNCNDGRGEERVRKRLAFIRKLFSASDTEDFINKFYVFMEKIGLKTDAVDFSEQTALKLLKSVNAERLGNNPVSIDLSEKTAGPFAAFFRRLNIQR